MLVQVLDLVRINSASLDLCPHPDTVVRRDISPTTQTQLLGNVDVSFCTDRAVCRYIACRRLGSLPLDPAIWTGDFSSSLGSGPLVETALVQIVSTCSHAPYNCFSFRLQLLDTDGAISFARLAITILFTVCGSLARKRSSMVKDFAKLGCQKGKLVVEICRSFEHLDKDVDDVLALWISLDKVGTCASRLMSYANVVDVASRTSHFHNFFGTIWSSMRAVRAKASLTA